MQSSSESKPDEADENVITVHDDINSQPSNPTRSDSSVGGADDANLVSSALEQESKGNSRLRKQARSSMRDAVRHGGRAIVERGARVKRVLKNQTPVSLLWMRLACVVTVWCLLGMVYYHYMEGWSLVGSMFYAVNVGLGVGYGVYNVSYVATKWFTVVYCLIGSSFIAGAGALLVQTVLERQDSMLEEARNYALQHPDEQTRERMGKWEYFWRKRKGRLYMVAFFIVWIIVGMVFALQDQLHCEPQTVSGNAQSNSNATGNACDGWAEAAFFVTTSLSTASQVPPKEEPFPLWFTIVYIFVGIPLYGAMLSLIADTYISHFQREQVRRMVKETPTVSRKSFNQMLEMNANRLTRLDSAPKVEWGDYLEHQLRKLGVVDRKLLDALKRSFQELDDKATGRLTESRINPGDFVNPGLPPVGEADGELEMSFVSSGSAAAAASPLASINSMPSSSSSSPFDTIYRPGRKK